jgi:hypothetical protein
MTKSLTCLIVVLFTIPSCFGWGPTGHRATGLVADRYLTKKARTAVMRILQGQSLAMASTWMDDIRSDSTFDYMADWHWVTIPPHRSYDQIQKNPNGDLIQTLDRVIHELRSTKLSKEDEADRLKILIHLVGDIHQPLHVGDRDDRGGNNVRLTWFSDQSNLHRVWDSDMIDGTKLSYTELAQSLDNPPAQTLRDWQEDSIYEWAKESQSYHDGLYDIGDGRLGYRYAYVHLPTVRHRLLQAGVRLAGILNDLYG